jgi:hypothetical protein
MDEFFAKKLENQATMEKQDCTADALDGAGKVTSMESKACEKLFVVAETKIDNHNIGIQYDVTENLEAKELKLKKLTVERKGY